MSIFLLPCFPWPLAQKNALYVVMFASLSAGFFVALDQMSMVHITRYPSPGFHNVNYTVTLKSGFGTNI